MHKAIEHVLRLLTDVQVTVSSCSWFQLSITLLEKLVTDIV